MGQDFFVGVAVFAEHHGVVEADMDDFGFAGEHRAVFVRVRTDRDDIVEGNVLEIADVFRFVLRHIDADFRHDFHREGTHAAR